MDTTDSYRKIQIQRPSSCAVKDVTEHRMISRIKRYSKEKPLLLLDVSQRQQELIESFSPNSYSWVHISEKTLQVIDASLARSKGCGVRGFMSTKVNLPRLRLNPVASIIEISSGCLSECSFCQTISQGTLRS